MKHLMIVLFSCLLVAACGGGGGGGGDGKKCPTCQACQECPAPQECSTNPQCPTCPAGCELDGVKAPITKTNAVKAAIDPLNTAGAALLSANFSSYVLYYFGYRNLPLSAAAAAATEETCPEGGTYTREIIDPDANGPSSGDSYNFTFTDCHFNNNILNGSFKVALVLVTDGNPMSSPFTQRYDYDQFSIQRIPYENNARAAPKNGPLQSSSSQNWRIILTGDMTFDMSYNQEEVIKLSGASLNTLAFFEAPFLGEKSVNRTISSYVFQWNITGDSEVGATISLKGALDSDYIGGSVDFETPASSPIKWVYGSDYPSTGQMNVTGLCNSKVTLNILNDTNVQLLVDTKGNGVSQTVDTTWADLEKTAITVFFYFLYGFYA